MHPYELTLSEASALIAGRELSPRELTASLLDRVAERDGPLGSYAAVFADSATREAAVAEKDIARHGQKTPLHGIPITVKDLCDVAGEPTRAGSTVRQGHRAAADATVVTLLRAAGAIVAGKAQTHEFAYGVTTPLSRNPWDLDRSPGGSSGGSGAAVAARLTMASLGTDTGGSIRIPAAVCGVVGLKPTYGRVPTDGLTPLSWSLDHAGPIARTVRDVALVADQIITLPRATDPVARGGAAASATAASASGGAVTAGSMTRAVDTAGDNLRGITVGVPENHYFDRCFPEVEQTVRAAVSTLEKLGARLRPLTVPLTEETYATGTLILASEAASYHRTDLLSRGHLYLEETRAKLENGSLILARDYVTALRVRSRLQAAWRTMFEDIDVLVSPTVPAPAVRAGEAAVTFPDGAQELVTPVYARTTFPANVCGVPALSVPCGFTASGLPIGMQLMGRPFSEEVLLRVGHVYESASSWVRHAPDMPLPRAEKEC